MNQEQVQGKWEQLKGAAKTSWGRLTDDDITKADGSIEKLYGIIHEKFGDTKEAIKAKLEPKEQQRESSEVRPDNKPKESSNQDNNQETHMMRGALRALFAVGVIMVLFRMTRRVTGRRERSWKR